MALFPAGSTKLKFCNFLKDSRLPQTVSYYPDTTTPVSFNVYIGLGYSPFARHYLGNRFCFLFLWVLRCFSSPGLGSGTYVFSSRILWLYHRRFADSVIPGSKEAYSYPRLFAVCHDLHRLSVPRHPSCALSSLTTKKIWHCCIYLRIKTFTIFNEQRAEARNLYVYGGRTWTRTRDLVLIRDAL